MSVTEYLRQQAATCQRLARATFDLNTAERLRFLAAELRAKADELEDQETVDAHMIQGNSFARSTGPD
jgi:precorrin isomerase